MGSDQRASMALALATIIYPTPLWSQNLNKHRCTLSPSPLTSPYRAKKRRLNMSDKRRIGDDETPVADPAHRASMAERIAEIVASKLIAENLVPKPTTQSTEPALPQFLTRAQAARVMG